VGTGAEFGAGGNGRRGGMLVFIAFEPACADKECAGSMGGGGAEGGSGSVAYLLNIWILSPVAPLTGQYSREGLN